MPAMRGLALTFANTIGIVEVECEGAARRVVIGLEGTCSLPFTISAFEIIGLEGSRSLPKCRYLWHRSSGTCVVVCGIKRLVLTLG
eukprot:735547-Rhodomonas_salina.1